MLDIEKSTLALAASVAGGCRSCADYHLGALERAGGGKAEKDAALAAAACGVNAFRDGMLAHARREDAPEPCCDGGDRTAALLGLVVALAVADSAQVRRFRAQAEATGASAADLAVVMGLAKQIRERAAHYAEQAFGETAPACAPGCGCG